MSDGIMSPVLRDIMVMITLIVSLMAFIFAAYAWSMLQSNKQHFTKFYGFMDEYEKLKENMKDVEKRLHKEEIKLKATIAANRLGRAGLIPKDNASEEEIEAAIKQAEEEAEAAQKAAAEGGAAAGGEAADPAAGTAPAEGGQAAAGARQGPAWQEFIDKYNALAANMDVPRVMEVCEGFVKQNRLATLVFAERDKLTDQMKFAIVEKVPQSVYWAKMIEGEVGRYVVVPNPMVKYDNDLHENGGMKETFASNYAKGGHYNRYQVKLPALFRAKLGNWRIDKPGLLELG